MTEPYGKEESLFAVREDCKTRASKNTYITDKSGHDMSCAIGLIKMYNKY